MYLSARVEKEKCIGCKICIVTCPEPNVFVFHKEEKKAEVVVSRCKACGLCVTVCPKKCITVS